MHGVAVTVSQNLRFDVLGINDALLKEDVRRAKGLGGLGDNPWPGLFQLGLIVTSANTATAATGGGLEHHRVTHPLGFAHGFRHVGEVVFGAGGDRYASGNHAASRLGFVAHASNYIAGRTDKLNPALSADMRQLSIFR